MQLLHSIRIELEESLREVIEQKFDAIEAMQSRGNSRRRRSSPAPRDLQAGSATATSNQDDVMEDENEYGPSGAAYIPQIENDRQFQLFPSGEPRENPLPSLEEQMRSLLDQPKQKVIREIQREEKPRRKEEDGYISMIRVLPDAELYDDIPDIENLPKLEEVDRSDAVPDPKAIRIKSERYIDDIPDIDEL
ncbi:MAG: hypothetical protein HGA26_05420 [Chlorobiaceae bacterium]|nr:hypothetical protein [Chlorobiaceae bacterium]